MGVLQISAVFSTNLLCNILLIPISRLISLTLTTHRIDHSCSSALDCIVYTVYFTIHIRSKKFTVDSTVYSVQFTVYSLHCTVPYTAVCRNQCTVYSVHCTVYSVQLTVYSVPNRYYTQCTVYSVAPGRSDLKPLPTRCSPLRHKSRSCKQPGWRRYQQ